MKFLLDANMPYSSVDVIKAFAHDAVHASDIGLGSAHDEIIMKYATKRKMILVTKDLGFGTLAVYLHLKTYGIIILRLPFSYTAKEINANLRSFLSEVSIRRVIKAIAVVEPGKYRIRKL